MFVNILHQNYSYIHQPLANSFVRVTGDGWWSVIRTGNFVDGHCHRLSHATIYCSYLIVAHCFQWRDFYRPISRFSFISKQRVAALVVVAAARHSIRYCVGWLSWVDAVGRNVVWSSQVRFDPMRKYGYIIFLVIIVAEFPCYLCVRTVFSVVVINVIALLLQYYDCCCCCSNSSSSNDSDYLPTCGLVADYCVLIWLFNSLLRSLFLSHFGAHIHSSVWTERTSVSSQCDVMRRRKKKRMKVNMRSAGRSVVSFISFCVYVCFQQNVIISKPFARLASRIVFVAKNK